MMSRWGRVPREPFRIVGATSVMYQGTNPVHSVQKTPRIQRPVISLTQTPLSWRNL